MVRTRSAPWLPPVNVASWSAPIETALPDTDTVSPLAVPGVIANSSSVRPTVPWAPPTALNSTVSVFPEAKLPPNEIPPSITVAAAFSV